MLTPDDLQAILDRLHASGYRLRKVSADGIEVAEAGPSLELSAPREAQQHERATLEQEAREEAEADKWAHVGGKPAILDRNGKREKSPWADSPSERD